jgi:hypothetical protein
MASTERWQYLSGQERVGTVMLPNASACELRNEVSTAFAPATEMPGHGKASIAFHQGQRLSGTSEGRQTSTGMGQLRCALH